MKFFELLNSLSLKLLLLVGLISISILSIFSYIIIKSHREALIHLVKHNAHQLSASVKHGIRFAMIKNNPDRIQKSITSIGEQDEIERIRIFNTSDKIIFSSMKEDFRASVKTNQDFCTKCHQKENYEVSSSSEKCIGIFQKKETGEKYLNIIDPIINSPSCWKSSCHYHSPEQKVLGYLNIIFSLNTMESQVSETQGKLVEYTMIAILSILATILIFNKILISVRLKKMLKATNAVSRGNLSFKLTINSSDELGILAKSFNDMTHKLAQTQRKLYQSDRLAYLGRLAASVAHEINNPLTGILTYGGFLLKRTEDESMKNDFTVIVHEADRCRNIVKGLLDFARQVPSQKTLFDVHKVIEAALLIVDNQLSLANIEIQKEYDNNIPGLWLDKVQMQHVFINLFVNSADAIGAHGGKIIIKSFMESMSGGYYCHIEITDNGCGIPENKFEEIFDPFFTTKEGKGTGLGLAVVWGIIEEHKGMISVKSELNKGSTFTIQLPIKT
jgi:two-component system NtrC family sensor kinase